MSVRESYTGFLSHWCPLQSKSPQRANLAVSYPVGTGTHFFPD